MTIKNCQSAFLSKLLVFQLLNEMQQDTEKALRKYRKVDIDFHEVYIASFIDV